MAWGRNNVLSLSVEQDSKKACHRSCSFALEMALCSKLVLLKTNPLLDLKSRSGSPNPS